jgi:cyanate permease
VLLGIGTLGYFLFTFSWYSLAAYLVPIIAELGLSGTQAGVVTGAVQLSYIPLSLISGLIIDRLGSRRSLTVGLIIIGIAHIFRGISDGFLTILGPTMLLGVGGTAITFGLPKLVSELFPPNRSGTMSSVYIIGATLGSATVFAIARPVVGPLIGGWRPFFLITGVIVVGFAVVWYVVSWYLWNPVTHAGQEDEQGFSVGSMRNDLIQIFTHYGWVVLVSIGTVRLFISHGLSNWLPTILESQGMAPAVAGTITSLFIIIRIVGIVSIPVVSDRFGTRRLPVMACSIAGTIGLLGLIFASNTGVVLFSLVLIGVFVIGGLSPLVRAIPIEMDGIGPRLTAVANGFIFTVGEIGGFMGPFLIGSLYDFTGSFTPSLMILAGATFVAVIAGYHMNEPSNT